MRRNILLTLFGILISLIMVFGIVFLNDPTMFVSKKEDTTGISYDVFYCTVETGSLTHYKLISDGIGESLKWSTKASLIENETRVMRNVKSVLLFGESVLVFFSGICLMGVLLFSIKERVPEIGVRKAFGAGKADIVFLILFESVLVGIITSFFAVCASFYICKTAEYIIVSKMHILFSIRFSFSDFLLPILIGIAETVMLSIGPAVKASKINASDAVRFV